MKGRSSDRIDFLERLITAIAITFLLLRYQNIFVSKSYFFLSPNFRIQLDQNFSNK
jgi:hypothetical protein